MDDLTFKENRLNKLITYLFSNKFSNCSISGVKYINNGHELHIEDCYEVSPLLCSGRDHSHLKMFLNDKFARAYAYDESYHNSSEYNHDNKNVEWEPALDFALSKLNSLAVAKMHSDEEAKKSKELQDAEQAALNKLIGL